MEIGLVSAFVGGLLALLSPCGALMLPAFFASTIGSGPRLWLHGGVFYLGMTLVLVPLGVGAGALGTLLVVHRSAIVIGCAVLMVVLGCVQLLGFGIDFERLVPGTTVLRERSLSATGLAKSALLGAGSGIAGFCAGPILGAILTLAAAQGDILTAGTLLAVYGAGMVIPLLLLASMWGRVGGPVRKALKGRTFLVFGRKLHSTSVISGLLVVAAGVLFGFTNGFVNLPHLLPPAMEDWLQERTAVLGNPLWDVLALVLLVCVAAVWWWRRSKRTVPAREE